MSSHDPIRFAESTEDCALREELRQMLGAPSGNFFGVEPTPGLIALADDLRREAERRRRTARHRPAWMLLAAGLPLVLVFAGMASWGVQQKRRADALAADILKKEEELQRAAVIQERQNQNLQLVLAMVQKPALKGGKPGAGGPPPIELVIPIPTDSHPMPPQTSQQVKDH